MQVYNKRFSSIAEIFNIKKQFHIIAGPCAVENIEQIEEIAKFLKKNGCHFLRAGAYKPRTNPYDFQGLGEEGLKILDFIRKKYGLKVVSEIVDPRDINKAQQYIDVIQIGSRNMQNYNLLKEAGKSGQPVLLKRGMMSTVKEFLMAAEYIISEGNDNVVLCERGIRTFENCTRNTLDLSCVAIIKQETTIPIIVDLSHSLGRTDILPAMFNAVKSVGADGVMVELHNNPQAALSDRHQQINFCEFDKIFIKENKHEKERD